jgi:hypothetical protein
MMEVASASEMLLYFYHATQHNNPEHRHLQIIIFVLWKPLSYFITYAASNLNLISASSTSTFYNFYHVQLEYEHKSGCICCSVLLFPPNSRTELENLQIMSFLTKTVESELQN